MVKEFPYNAALLRRLEETLSPDRLTGYHRETGNDLQQSIQLYSWNTEISAAFYAPLQGLEICLRNAMHRELAQAYRTNWYDDPAPNLTAAARQHIDRARRELLRENKPDDAPHIVAALPFGFWEKLLSHGQRGQRNYEITLWRPALHRAFPHAKPRRRQTVHTPIIQLRNLRNRIAHHEPIFRRNLQADYDDILKVLGWMCPDTRDWVAHHNRIAETLARHPQQKP